MPHAKHILQDVLSLTNTAAALVSRQLGWAREKRGTSLRNAFSPRTDCQGCEMGDQSADFDFTG